MKNQVLGVPFNITSREEALKTLIGFLDKDKHHILITPNPEIIMTACEDEKLMEIIKEADMVTADGIGVIYGSKILRGDIKERVEGCDTVLNLFDAIKDTDKTVYLLGAKPGVAKQAMIEMPKKYKNLSIIGASDGYFDSVREKEIIKEIQDLKPDVLIVGLGCPRQEKWVYEHRDELPVKLSACIGGAIDVMSGNVKRAPKFFRVTGTEFLYRLAIDPVRIKRMGKIPVFLVKCLFAKKYK